jgi:hypothetical protein
VRDPHPVGFRLSGTWIGGTAAAPRVRVPGLSGGGGRAGRRRGSEVAARPGGATWVGCRRRMGGGAGGRGRRKKLDMRRGSGVVARYTGPPLSEISVSGRFPGSTEYRY